MAWTYGVYTINPYELRSYGFAGGAIRNNDCITIAPIAGNSRVYIVRVEKRWYPSVAHFAYVKNTGPDAMAFYVCAEQKD